MGNCDSVNTQINPLRIPDSYFEHCGLDEAKTVILMKLVAWTQDNDNHHQWYIHHVRFLMPKTRTELNWWSDVKDFKAGERYMVERGVYSKGKQYASDDDHVYFYCRHRGYFRSDWSKKEIESALNNGCKLKVEYKLPSIKMSSEVDWR